MNKILLSIVIPTKNRTEYLLEVVKNILSIPDDRFELILQDNSDTTTLETNLSKLNYMDDDRLRYYYNEELLSFVENFSRGISNSRGEYIIFIGDDDTVNPYIVEIAEWALLNNINAITPSLPFVYFWPQTGFDDKIETGRLAISDYKGGAHVYNPQEELKRLLKNGAQNYLSYNLAKAYHGIVKTSFFHKMKDITGYHIGGLSPDIYLSVGLSLLIDKVVFIDYPLTISGICNKSGSADSATGRHTGKLEDAPHFKGHTNYCWAEQIPKFYSVETIWGDSAIHAICDINPTFLKYFNVNVISAYCRAKYPEFKNEIYENLSNNYASLPNKSIKFRWLLFYGFIIGPFKNAISRIFKRIVNKTYLRNKIKIFHNIENINKAMVIVNENLNKNVLLKRKTKNYV